MPLEQTTRRHVQLAHAPSEGEGVSDALERVHDASQRLLMRRLELVVEQARRLLLYTGIAGAGALVAAGGWALVVFAAVRAIDPEPARLAVAAVVGALHVAAGGFTVQRALRASHTEPG